MLDLGAVRSRERWEKHVWAVRLRATTLLGVTFVYVYLALSGRVPLDLFALAMIVGLFAFNAWRRKRVSKSFSRWMISADILLITLAIWATGGVATYLLPLYFVQIVATSLHTNPRQGVVAAFNAWALFAGVALLEAAGVLPHGPLAASPITRELVSDWGFVESQILSLFVLLGAVTYSAGFIAQRLRVREQELGVAHEELEILYQASQDFLQAESAAELSRLLCRHAGRLGARAVGVFLKRHDEGITALASFPDPLEPSLGAELQERARLWLERGEEQSALEMLERDPNFGLIRFQLGTGEPGAVVVRVEIRHLLREHTEGISLLVQQFSAALTNLAALEAHVQLATTDPLTGAANRRQFDQVLEEEGARARRYARPLSVILVDVDHFKRLNDTKGHKEGDRVLQGVVAAMRQALRSMDHLARYGGEEFVVLAPETGPKQAVILAERLRRAIEGQVFFPEGDYPTVTASLGVASRLPTADAPDGDTLVHRADLALYAAKHAGRNRVEAYRAALDPVSEPPELARSG